MSEQIDTCRMTGKPVDISDKDQFQAEWQRLYDIAERVCKKDVLRLQKKLALIERVLSRKYPTIVKTNLPTTQEEWKATIEKYGGGPLLVCQSTDDGRIILVIQDVEFERYG